MERNDTRKYNDNSNNGADMASTAIDEQERMRILRDIKAIIGRDTDESSEIEKIFFNTTNNTVPITDKSFETNESINDTKTEASEFRIFHEEFQPPPELIPSQNLDKEQEQEGTNESNTSTETTSEEERNKIATKKIAEKNNDMMVETEREHTIEKTEEE